MIYFVIFSIFLHPCSSIFFLQFLLTREIFVGFFSLFDSFLVCFLHVFWLVFSVGIVLLFRGLLFSFFPWSCSDFSQCLGHCFVQEFFKLIVVYCYFFWVVLHFFVEIIPGLSLFIRHIRLASWRFLIWHVVSMVKVLWLASFHCWPPVLHWRLLLILLLHIVSAYWFGLSVWKILLLFGLLGPVLVCHSRPLYAEPSCLCAFLSSRCPGPGLLGQLPVGMCAWCHHRWVLLPLLRGCSCVFCKPTVAIYL